MNIDPESQPNGAAAVDGQEAAEPLRSGKIPASNTPTIRRARLPRFNAGQTFAALKYPNYRLWFYGQLASLVGTWMQTTAEGYLIYQLTHSPAYLGYVGFAAGVPSWLLMLYGGVVSDRMSRRKLLVITQSSMMVLAFIMAILVATGYVRPWQIIVEAFLLGIANAFDVPARQAFTLEMVSHEDLGNAIALNSAMFNSATAIGPAVAGLTYAAFGPAICFTINGISFLAVIAALLRMQFKPFVVPPRITSAMVELKEGLAYVAHHPDIRTLITVVGVSSLFGLAYATLIPAWAVSILGGNSTTNGLLQSARGVGSLIGALMIASLGSFSFRGKLLTLGTFIFPTLLIVFSFIRVIPLSLLVLVGVGWGSMILFNMCNNLVQSLVPDDLRGRVMGLYSLTFMGVTPVGSLVFGSLASRIGTQETVLISAAITLTFAFALLIAVPRLRRL
ncbi:MAG: MFS transporter [Chloroflexi bacterium]|nr:MFS transporter [Chloroflexota bacterium]